MLVSNRLPCCCLRVHKALSLLSHRSSPAALLSITQRIQCCTMLRANHCTTLGLGPRYLALLHTSIRIRLRITQCLHVSLLAGQRFLALLKRLLQRLTLHTVGMRCGLCLRQPCCHRWLPLSKPHGTTRLLLHKLHPSQSLLLLQLPTRCPLSQHGTVLLLQSRHGRMLGCHGRGPLLHLLRHQLQCLHRLLLLRLGCLHVGKSVFPRRNHRLQSPDHTADLKAIRMLVSNRLPCCCLRVHKALSLLSHRNSPAALLSITQRIQCCTMLRANHCTTLGLGPRYLALLHTSIRIRLRITQCLHVSLLAGQRFLALFKRLLQRLTLHTVGMRCGLCLRQPCCHRWLPLSKPHGTTRLLRHKLHPSQSLLLLQLPTRCPLSQHGILLLLQSRHGRMLGCHGRGPLLHLLRHQLQCLHRLLLLRLGCLHVGKSVFPRRNHRLQSPDHTADLKAIRMLVSNRLPCCCLRVHKALSLLSHRNSPAALLSITQRIQCCTMLRANHCTTLGLGPRYLALLHTSIRIRLRITQCLHVSLLAGQRFHALLKRLLQRLTLHTVGMRCGLCLRQPCCHRWLPLSKPHGTTRLLLHKLHPSQSLLLLQLPTRCPLSQHGTVLLLQSRHGRMLGCHGRGPLLHLLRHQLQCLHRLLLLRLGCLHVGKSVFPRRNHRLQSPDHTADLEAIRMLISNRLPCCCLRVHKALSLLSHRNSPAALLSITQRIQCCTMLRRNHCTTLGLGPRYLALLHTSIRIRLRITQCLHVSLLAGQRFLALFKRLLQRLTLHTVGMRCGLCLRQPCCHRWLPLSKPHGTTRLLLHKLHPSQSLLLLQLPTRCPLSQHGTVLLLQSRHGRMLGCHGRGPLLHLLRHQLQCLHRLLLLRLGCLHVGKSVFPRRNHRLQSPDHTADLKAIRMLVSNRLPCCCLRMHKALSLLSHRNSPAALLSITQRIQCCTMLRANHCTTLGLGPRYLALLHTSIRIRLRITQCLHVSLLAGQRFLALFKRLLQRLTLHTVGMRCGLCLRQPCCHRWLPLSKPHGTTRLLLHKLHPSQSLLLLQLPTRCPLSQHGILLLLQSRHGRMLGCHGRGPLLHLLRHQLQCLHRLLLLRLGCLHVGKSVFPRRNHRLQSPDHTADLEAIRMLVSNRLPCCCLRVHKALSLLSHRSSPAALLSITQRIQCCTMLRANHCTTLGLGPRYLALLHTSIRIRLRITQCLHVSLLAGQRFLALLKRLLQRLTLHTVGMRCGLCLRQPCCHRWLPLSKPHGTTRLLLHKLHPSQSLLLLQLPTRCPLSQHGILLLLQSRHGGMLGCHGRGPLLHLLRHQLQCLHRLLLLRLGCLHVGKSVFPRRNHRLQSPDHTADLKAIRMLVSNRLPCCCLRVHKALSLLSHRNSPAALLSITQRIQCCTMLRANHCTTLGLGPRYLALLHTSIRIRLRITQCLHVSLLAGQRFLALLKRLLQRLTLQTVGMRCGLCLRQPCTLRTLCCSRLCQLPQGHMQSILHGL